MYNKDYCYYQISDYQWNGENYEPFIVYEGNNFERALERFEKMKATKDAPRIELRGITVNNEHIIKTKEV